MEIGDDVVGPPILLMAFTKNYGISSAVHLTPLLSVYPLLTMRSTITTSIILRRFVRVAFNGVL